MIAATKDVFLGAPSQDWARQTDRLTYALKKLVMEVLLAAFLKKRMKTLTTTEKTTSSSKGNADICLFF